MSKMSSVATMHNCDWSMGGGSSIPSTQHKSIPASTTRDNVHDCAIIDEGTIFSTRRLAASGCFEEYNVILCPDGEEPAANLIRVNDVVIMRTGFPETTALLESNGYQVDLVQADEAALIDGGLSCMSLRCAW